MDETIDSPRQKRQARLLTAPANPDLEVRREQIMSMMSKLKQRPDVKAILQGISDGIKFKVPTNRRQRRTIMQRKGKNDVSEVYSPPRMIEVAESVGLKGGWAVDLTQVDPDDGMPWDLSIEAKQKKVMRKVKEDEPFMLISSPMCGPFSVLNASFNYPKMTTEEVTEKLKAAAEPIRFTLELCLEQHKQGRMFLFEHPADASTWTLKCMHDMMAIDGVYSAKFDFCMLGMRTKDKDGNDAFAKKRTRIMTNSPAITELLREAQCHGRHRHEPLLGGKAGPCQEYPEKFCRLICEGIKREIDTLDWKEKICKAFDISQVFGRLMSFQAKVDSIANVPEENPFEHLYDDAEFIDDVTGQPLEKAEAIKARKTEIDFFRARGVYTKVHREDWMRIITTKWLDINKGDDVAKNYRARLVGREIAKTKRHDLFAATPPLESLRMILSICASNQWQARPQDRYIVMSNDVKRAYFYAQASRPIFIRIPDEDWQPGDEDKVGRLNLSLYGTRDAAMNWGAKYTDVLEKIGFVKGNASPCNFYHPTRNVSMTVHGDDFTSCGTEKDLKWVEMAIQAEFELTTHYLGPDVNKHEQELRILNRVIGWGDSNITYEADQRHAEIIIREMGLEDAKAVTTPGSREEATLSAITADDINSPVLDPDDPEARGELLSPSDTTAFRALVARGNYLAQDRVEIQYAVKEAARRMSKPRSADWNLLKRIGRFLKGMPRVVYRYDFQAPTGKIDTFSDSDWAGCKTSKRSTSGGGHARDALHQDMVDNPSSDSTVLGRGRALRLTAVSDADARAHGGGR